ncbi:MAG: hypothetical protein E7635_05725 [Ruminococcaceae bacterium]|nr:hypothetical protein [Oscillospiraceae bacterium]
MGKIITVLVLAVATVLMLGACNAKQNEDIFALPKYIMHAGGVMSDGRAETNSIDALNASYENGNYWLELDFNRTSDGKWVCVHDWDAFYSVGVTGMKNPDSQTFEEHRKSAYGYESPTLDVLIRWMKKHPKAVIVTDVKENNQEFARYVSESYPELAERFVIQIYNRDEYKAVAESGFERIIYTLYKELPEQRYDTELLSDFVQNSEKLIALTYAGYRENAEDISAVCELDIPVYIHTINDPADQSYWREFGAFGFYSDYVADTAK